MKITYAASADVAYIYLDDRTRGIGGIVEKSYRIVLEELNNIDFVLDFDENNHLLGIEVLEAKASLSPAVLKEAELIGED